MCVCVFLVICLYMHVLQTAYNRSITNGLSCWSSSAGIRLSPFSFRRRHSLLNVVVNLSILERSLPIDSASSNKAGTTTAFFVKCM